MYCYFHQSNANKYSQTIECCGHNNTASTSAKTSARRTKRTSIGMKYKIDENLADPDKYHQFKKNIQSQFDSEKTQREFNYIKELIIELLNIQKDTQKITLEAFSRMKESNYNSLNKLTEIENSIKINQIELEHNTAQIQTLAKELFDLNRKANNMQIWMGSNVKQGNPILNIIEQNTESKWVVSKRIAISFSPANNRVFSGASHGWVSNFYNNLDILLKEKLSDNAFDLWMSSDVSGNEESTQSYIEKIENSSALIVILSEAYVNCSNCMLQLQSFLTLNEVKDKRVFVVEYDNVAHPPELDDLKGYKFWSNGGKIRTLATPSFNESVDYDYFPRLNEIARDLVGLLTD